MAPSFWLDDGSGIGPVVLSDDEGLHVGFLVQAGAPILLAAPRLYEAVRRVLATVVQVGNGATFVRLSRFDLEELRAAVALVERRPVDPNTR